MYQFLQYDTGAIGNIILGIILLIVGLIMYLKVRNENDSFWSMSLVVAMIFALVVLILGGIQLRDETTSKSLTAQQAYTVEKEGDLIRFKLLISNEALKDKVTVRVISETKNKYQVEYKGRYYSIDKVDVQKGN